MTKLLEIILKEFPNPFLLVNCDACSFTFHSKEYLKLHMYIISTFVDLKKIPKPVLHVICDAYSINFHSKEYDGEKILNPNISESIVACYL